MAELTTDAILGGRLRLRQPRRGHRVGHDAVMLAAATAARAREHAVDLGAGVGAAGLALAARVDDLRVTLVEIDHELAALAAENALLNGMGDRVRAVTLAVDARARDFAAAGLAPGCARRVLMNPPFSDPLRQNASPHPRRQLAHTAPAGTLAVWVKTAGRLLDSNGVLSLIWRADDLAQVLAALGGFGAVTVMPVHPKPEAAAIRVLVRAAKNTRAPLQLLPGLILNDADGKPSAEAEAVLRGGDVLPLARMA
jgi:tRNA1(Val) A37 N6-methylase TrmN6